LLEDDAYHYLSFDPDHLVPSYFELEAQDGGQQGRVLRFDSFSKILSSGSSALVLRRFCGPMSPTDTDAPKWLIVRHALGLCDGTAAAAGDHRLAHIKHKPAAFVSSLNNGNSRREY
jgi:hypothetical protein